MAARGGWEQLVMLDRKAAELARGVGATMVRLGEVLGEGGARRFGSRMSVASRAWLGTWCHLEGVHGGRIRVAPPASRMRWSLGGGLLEIHGRGVVR